MANCAVCGQGATLAENIGRYLTGQDLKRFTFKGLGELASIGHRTAVANIMGLQFSGVLAWFMWRTIYLAKLPGLDRRLRVTIEWTLDFFFPRDITLLSPRYTKHHQQVHLEPDDILFTKGEPAFSLYAVRQGQVDLLDEDGRVVRSIGEGDYFGERALVHGNGYLYDAIARGRTELVSLSGEVVLPFLQSSRRFRRILAKTTAQGSAEAEIESVMKKLDKSLLNQPAAAVMRTDLATLRSDQTIGDALELFKQRRFSIYPLVDAEGKLVGVLNREDLFDFIKRDDTDNSTPLSEIDLMHLPNCQTSQPVASALEKMIHYGRYKCLVTDTGERLCGIITVMDLLGEAVAAPKEVAKLG
jgi:NADH dehydrogenase